MAEACGQLIHSFRKSYLPLDIASSLSGHAVSFTYPQNVRFACERCAICCGDAEFIARNILLLGIEAKRISLRTHKNIEQFAHRVEGCEPYSFRMKKTKEGKCIFLEEGLCSVYDARPLVCRFYPFQLKNVGDGEHAFAYTKECPGIGKGVRLRKSFFRNLFLISAELISKDAEEP